MTGKTEKEKGDNPNQQPNPYTAPRIEQGGVSNSDNPQNTAKESTQHTHTKDNHTIIVNVTNPQKGKNNAEWWSVGINAGLFMCTLILAGISMWQGCLTRRSVAIADSVFKADTAFNDKTYQQSRIDAKANDKREDGRDKRENEILGIQDSTLKAQINSFTETQKEFKIENEAYLQVGYFDTVKFKGINPIISYFISNLSKDPAKIIKGYLVSFSDVRGGDVKKRIDRYEDSIQPYKNVSMYIIKETPQGQNYYWPTYMDSVTFKNLTTGKWDVYLFGRFIYENLVNKKNRMYKFCVELSISNKGNYRMRYDDNVDLK